MVSWTIFYVELALASQALGTATCCGRETRPCCSVPKHQGMRLSKSCAAQCGDLLTRPSLIDQKGTNHSLCIEKKTYLRTCSKLFKLSATLEAP